MVGHNGDVAAITTDGTGKNPAARQNDKFRVNVDITTITLSTPNRSIHFTVSQFNPVGRGNLDVTAVGIVCRGIDR